MIKKLVFIFCAAFLIASCAYEKIAQQDVGQVRKIAVYSALGTELNYDVVNTTGFTDVIRDIDVPEMAFNDYAEQSLVKHVEAKGYQAHAIDPVGAGRQYDVSDGDIENLITYAASQGDDTLIIILPFSVDSQGGADYWRPGYGISKKTFMGLEKYFAYTSVHFDAYDVRERKMMGWSKGYVHKPFHAPSSKALENWVWQADYHDYSPDEKRILVDSLKMQFDEGVTEAISAMGL